MTLLLLIQTSRHALFLSDRRLTTNGVVQDSAANKTISINFPGASILLGFTGLARAGSFDTRTFLLEQVKALMPLCLDWRTFAVRLAQALTEIFKCPPLSRVSDLNKGLAIAFVGAEVDGGYSYPIYGYITNAPGFSRGMENPTVGAFKAGGDRPPVPGLAVYGAWQAFSDQEREDLFRFIGRGPTIQVIAAKAADSIRRASESRKARHTIGREISWTALDRSSLEVTWGQYPHSFLESYSPDFAIWNVGDTDVGIASGISVTGPNPRYDMPSFERNRACPCGSGVQFRHCHGRKFINSFGVAIVHPDAVPGNDAVWPDDFPPDLRT
jgi:hypothetical protein